MKDVGLNKKEEFLQNWNVHSFDSFSYWKDCLQVSLDFSKRYTAAIAVYKFVITK